MERDGASPLTEEMKEKIIWQVSLFDTQLAEAKWLHDEIKKQKYRGISLFRNFVRQGGACSRPVNQLIACLGFGACDGEFRADRRKDLPQEDQSTRGTTSRRRP